MLARILSGEISKYIKIKSKWDEKRNPAVRPAVGTQPELGVHPEIDVLAPAMVMVLAVEVEVVAYLT